MQSRPAFKNKLSSAIFNTPSPAHNKAINADYKQRSGLFITLSPLINISTILPDASSYHHPAFFFNAILVLLLAILAPSKCCKGYQ